MMTLKRKLFGTNLGSRSLLTFCSGQILHFFCQKYFFFIWRTNLFSKVRKNSLSLSLWWVKILLIFEKLWKKTCRYIKRTRKFTIKNRVYNISSNFISIYALNIVDKFCGSKLANPLWPTLLLNTQNMTNPTIVSPVKMEYGWNFSISGLKMMVKSGLEKVFLKFLHALTIFY